MAQVGQTHLPLPQYVESVVDREASRGEVVLQILFPVWVTCTEKIWNIKMLLTFLNSVSALVEHLATKLPKEAATLLEQVLRQQRLVSGELFTEF